MFTFFTLFFSFFICWNCSPPVLPHFLLLYTAKNFRCTGQNTCYGAGGEKSACQVWLGWQSAENCHAKKVCAVIILFFLFSPPKENLNKVWNSADSKYRYIYLQTLSSCITANINRVCSCPLS